MPWNDSTRSETVPTPRPPPDLHIHERYFASPCLRYFLFPHIPPPESMRTCCDHSYTAPPQRSQGHETAGSQSGSDATHRDSRRRMRRILNPHNSLAEIPTFSGTALQWPLRDPTPQELNFLKASSVSGTSGRHTPTHSTYTRRGRKPPTGSHSSNSGAQGVPKEPHCSVGIS